jgi:IS5 family transposase
MKTKKQYRVRNWPEYNAALKQRASITFWVDESAQAGWLEGERSGKRGASRLYSDGAIECTLMVQEVYHLTLRGAQGFLHSLFGLMQLALPVPDYTTLCRRRQSAQMSVAATASAPTSRGLHLVVDSTGLKIYGEGEWKVRKHGWCKRRTWRSLHIGIDARSGQIVAAVMSEPRFTDKKALPMLLEQIEGEVASVTGDGAYDGKGCYEAIAEREAEAIIPPFRNGRLRKEDVYAPRNAALQRIRELEAQGQDGRALWKEEVGYHARSRIETTMMQLKRIFGDRLSSHDFDAQANQGFIRCMALNRMMQLPMPQSVVI